MPRRTNGALLEWLHSPIVYLERGHFAQDLRRLAPRAFNSIALCYHYSHMARGNAREYLFNDKVRLKKYFYVLRPLLAIRYIELGKGIPPVRFEALVLEIPSPRSASSSSPSSNGTARSFPVRAGLICWKIIASAKSSTRFSGKQ